MAAFENHLNKKIFLTLKKTKLGGIDEVEVEDK
jgi:hypothetical protein